MIEDMKKLSQKEIREIKEIRSKFPSEVAVHTRRSVDGGFYAEIKTFPGIFTEANTFSELIAMVNDAVLTYFEVPRKYAPLLPNYLPPLSEAQNFGIFPKIKQESHIKLKLMASK